MNLWNIQVHLLGYLYDSTFFVWLIYSTSPFFNMISELRALWVVGYQVTLAHLKDKPAPSTPTAPSSSFSTGSGVRSAAARLLGGGNGSRALSFVGGNGGSKSVSASSRVGSLVASSSSSSTSTSNFDGKGTYLIFNVGDAIFISDLNSQDKVFLKFHVLV